MRANPPALDGIYPASMAVRSQTKPLRSGGLITKLRKIPLRIRVVTNRNGNGLVQRSFGISYASRTHSMSEYGISRTTQEPSVT